jgi:hypothetical protein
MPRKVNPGDIVVGKGRLPQGTVADNSLRTPNRDIDPLRVHLHDPSRAHMASTIGIVDAAGCYVSDEVEGALQEICSGAAAGRLNGLVAGGTFNETFPHVGATLSLVAGTEVLLWPAVLDLAGATVDFSALPTGVYFIYVDADAASATYRTLVASTVLPEVETAAGIEDVMIAKVAWQSGPTTLNNYQDARFFVRNLDRKVEYSSRQGENVDAWSEGCFATLDAAFFWMENYGDAGTSEEEKGTILLRGTHELSATANVPTSFLRFVGDGEAIIQPTNGFVGSVLFELSSKSKVTFENLTFNALFPNLIAISATGASFDQLEVLGCDFLSTTADKFESAVAISSTLAEGCLIRDCKIWATPGATMGGILTDGTRNLRIENCALYGPGAGTAGSTGIFLGKVSTSVDTVISNCRIEDFEVGVTLKEARSVKISDSQILDVKQGVDAQTGVNDDLTVSGCSISVEDTSGLIGIAISNSTGVNVSDSRVYSPRNAYGAANPLGIYASSGVGKPLNLRVTGCDVEGFQDTTSGQGSGLTVDGNAAPDYAQNVTVTGNTFRSNPLAVDSVSGCTIDGNVVDGAIGDSAIFTNVCMNLVISNNTIGSFDASPVFVRTGIFAQAKVTGQVSTNVIISGNAVSHVSHPTAGTAYGIRLFGGVSQFEVVGNTVTGLDFAPFLPSAVGIQVHSTDAGQPARGVISSNTLTSLYDGIIVQGWRAPDFTISPVRDVIVSSNVLSFIVHPQDTLADTFIGVGTKGIGLEYCDDSTVVENRIGNLGVAVDLTGAPVVVPGNVWIVGLYFRDCLKNVEVARNQVLHPVSTGIGYTTGIWSNIAPDAAGASVTCAQMTVVDNRLEFDRAASVDKVGIAFTGYHAAVGVTAMYSNLRVLGNSIQVPSSGPGLKVGVLFSNQDLTGAPIGAYLSDVRVEGNKVEGFREGGIVFSYDSDAATVVGEILEEIVVDGNKLQAFAPTGAAVGAGVLAQIRSSATATAFVYNLNISNNWISAYDYGVSLSMVNGGLMPALRELEISGNTLRAIVPGPNVPTVGTFGIAVKLDGAFAQAVQGIRILGNILRDLTADCNVAVGLDLGVATPVQEVLIEDNKIRGRGGLLGNTGVVDVSSTGSVVTDTDFSDFSVSRNEVELYKAPTGSGLAVKLNLATNLKRFQADGNLIHSSDSGASPAFWFFNAGQSAAGVTVEDVSFHGNTCLGPVYFQTASTALVNMSAQDNTLTNILTLVSASPEACFGASISGGSGPASLDGLLFQGNTVSGVHMGFNLAAQNSTDVRNVQVLGNTISKQYPTSPGAAVPGWGIRLDQTIGGATGAWSSVSISGNDISDTPMGISVDLYEPAATGWKVDNNQFRNLTYDDGPQIEFLLGGQNPAVGGGIEGFSFSNNQLVGCTPSKTFPLVSLEPHSPFVPNPSTAHAVKFDGNTTTLCGSTNGAGCPGIYVDLEPWTQVGESSISGNSISTGDPSQFITNAIEVVLPESQTNTFKCDSNIISNPQSYGIKIDGGSSDGVSISDNNIRMRIGVAQAFGIYYGANGTGTPQIKNATISRNTVTDLGSNTTLGIWIGHTVGIPGSVDNMKVCDNQTFNTDGAIEINFAGVLGYFLSNLEVDRNQHQVEAGTVTGQVNTYHVEGLGCSGLSVSDNSSSLHHYALNQNGVFVSVVAGASVVRSISLDQNNILCYNDVDNTGSGVQLWTLGSGAMTDFSVSRNTVRGAREYGIRVSLDAGNDNPVAYVNVDGNNVFTPSTARIVGDGGDCANIALDFGRNGCHPKQVSVCNNFSKTAVVPGGAALIDQRYNFWFRQFASAGGALDWRVCGNHARDNATVSRVSVRTEGQAAAPTDWQSSGNVPVSMICTNNVSNIVLASDVDSWHIVGAALSSWVIGGFSLNDNNLAY